MVDAKKPYNTPSARVERFESDLNDQKKRQAIVANEATKAHWTRVGKASERFNKLQKAVGKENKLSEEDMVCAMYLNLLNWQHFYPRKLGGPDHFAELCKETEAWFRANV